jgi:hypothetical protein
LKLPYGEVRDLEKGIFLMVTFSRFSFSGSASVAITWTLFYSAGKITTSVSIIKN